MEWREWRESPLGTISGSNRLCVFPVQYHLLQLFVDNIENIDFSSFLVCLFVIFYSRGRYATVLLTFKGSC